MTSRLKECKQAAGMPEVITKECYSAPRMPTRMNTKQQALSGMGRDRAMFLANLNLIIYRANLRFTNLLQCDAIAAANPESTLLQDIFPAEFFCNDSIDFDPAALHRSRTYDSSLLEVTAWFWHTEKPVGPIKALRTLPFGFIAKDSKHKEIYIIFRGTITTAEWKKNLAVRKVDPYQSSRSLGLVHSGFRSIYESSFCDRMKERSACYTRWLKRLGRYSYPPEERRASIKQTIQREVIDKDWHKQDYRVYISGHSLGGALTMLAAQSLLAYSVEDYQDLLHVCTFAAPRTGNRDFCEWFDGVDVVRYVNTEDVVPTIPPSTGTVLGPDMQEVNDERIRAERQSGYKNLNNTFASTQGVARAPADVSPQGSAYELSVSNAFEHVGETRAFTRNMGSISYNHNLMQTYRRGIEDFG